MVEKACRKCKFIADDVDTCPSCGAKDMTEKFKGYVMIFDHEKSIFAKKLNAKTPGRYAIRVK